MTAVPARCHFQHKWQSCQHKRLQRDLKSNHGECSGKGPTLIDGVEDTLKYLDSKGYTLNVLTRGVEFEQLFKLEKSGIKHFFKDVVIVPQKNVETYSSTASRFNLEAGNLCMVGNSVKADVNPAVEAGWRAIHVPAPTVWAHDEDNLIDSDKAHRVDKISDIPRLISYPHFWSP